MLFYNVTSSLSLFTFMYWRRKWQPTPVLLPGKSHGQRSLVGYSPWGLEATDMTSLSLFTFMHWRRKWQPTPVFLSGKSHGQRSLVGYRPWGRKESDTTEATQLLAQFDLWKPNPVQRSCLENPRDGGAWWAAIYGVAQSRTQLKRLSSSSSSSNVWYWCSVNVKVNLF